MMPENRYTAVMGSQVKVNGSSMDMARMPPSPGTAPKIRPMMLPTQSVRMTCGSAMVASAPPNPSNMNAGVLCHDGVLSAPGGARGTGDAKQEAC